MSCAGLLSTFRSYIPLKILSKEFQTSSGGGTCPSPPVSASPSGSLLSVLLSLGTSDLLSSSSGSIFPSSCSGEIFRTLIVGIGTGTSIKERGIEINFFFIKSIM